MRPIRSSPGWSHGGAARCEVGGQVTKGRDIVNASASLLDDHLGKSDQVVVCKSLQGLSVALAGK